MKQVTLLFHELQVAVSLY